MSLPARIDELRKRFDENPRRYFAPLANEYRKAGEVDQAIALCREFLPNQPGHMSGHIVYGQALYESGDLEQARAVFSSALTLDPENLIALQHLGDIAKALGEGAVARRWFERVLDADPRNNDIAAQLAELAANATAANAADAVAEGAGQNDFAVSGDHQVVPEGDPAITDGVGERDPLNAQAGPGQPDPELHAVDFDAVNESIAQLPPLDPDSIDSLENVSVTIGEDATNADEFGDFEAERESQELQPRHEGRESSSQQSQDAQDVKDAGPSGDTEPPLVEGRLAESDGDVPAEEELRSANAEEHSYEFSNEAMSDAFSGDVLDRENDVPLMDLAPEFEEGMLAPQWPDTSDLVARLLTPRDSTVITSPTIPESASPDTLDAFGREWEEAAPVTESAGMVVEAEGNVDTVEEVAEQDSLGIQAVADVEAQDVEAEAAEVEAAEAEAESIYSRRANYDSDLAFPGGIESESPTGMNVPEEMVEDVAEVEPAFASHEQDVVAPDEDVVAHNEDVVAHNEDVTANDEDNQREVRETFLVDADSPVEESLAGSAEIIPPASREPAPAFVTETMGELLVSQGFISRAVDVYEELVRRRPYDPVLSSRLAELSEMVALDANTDVGTETAADDQNAEPEASSIEEPQSDPIAEVFLDESARDIFPSPDAVVLNDQTSEQEPANASTNANEFDDEPQLLACEVFAELAAYRVPRRTPISAMFAIAPVERSESHANERAATSSPDSVGDYGYSSEDSADSLDSLFGRTSVFQNGSDDLAARALADAFAPISEEDMMSGATLEMDVEEPEAFEQVTPTYEPPAARNDADFSFDRFFPDPAMQPASNPAITPHEVLEAPSTSFNAVHGNIDSAVGMTARVDESVSTEAGHGAKSESESESDNIGSTEDMAEFSAWLKGLGNS